MELDKRVAGIETELKIIKGEMKELLVDIRDRMNSEENPFCKIRNQGAQNFEAAKNEAAVEEEKADQSKQEETMQGTLECETPYKEVPEKGDPEKEKKLSFRDGIDTFLLVELMRWVDYAVRTIGHRNLENLLNLYTITGELSDEVKGVIQNIENLSTEETAEESEVNMKDNIMVISQLSAILNPGESGTRIQPIYEEKSGGEKKEKKTELAFN